MTVIDAATRILDGTLQDTYSAPAVIGLSNSAVIYLSVMLSVILVLTALLVPALFLKRCGKCGARNALDATECRRCKRPFPDDETKK